VDQAGYVAACLEVASTCSTLICGPHRATFRCCTPSGPNDCLRKGAADVDTEICATSPNEDAANSSYEIEFALVLSRMIDAAYGDPAQLRSTIYELARVKLRKEVLRGEVEDETRLINALDVAIRSVESFSKREDKNSRFPLLPRSVTAQIANQSASAAPVLLIEHGSTAARPNLPEKPVRSNIRRSIVGVVLVTIVTISAFAIWGPNKSGTEQSEKSNNVVLNKNSPPEITGGTQPVVSGQAGLEAGWPPLPTVYGVYALNNGQFQEVYRLPGQVPDKRVAISAPINSPSQTTLADGKITFLIFRRDLVTSAPEHVELRVVAKVMRAMTFDRTGKSSIAPVGETWTVRNISHPFRVAPLPGNPEMMVLKSEQPDFTLSSGRYVVVIKGQGYDFTVAGPISDPTHCLEKIEAANGSFYAECKKP
jgi:hypothetical protein